MHSVLLRSLFLSMYKRTFCTHTRTGENARGIEQGASFSTCSPTPTPQYSGTLDILCVCNKCSCARACILSNRSNFGTASRENDSISHSQSEDGREGREREKGTGASRFIKCLANKQTSSFPTCDTTGHMCF